MVEAGKPEEYRDIKPFWNRIFSTGNIKIKGKYYHPTDVIICFSNGYSKNRRQMRVKCKGLRVGFGDIKYGADPENQQWILRLGEHLPF